YAQAAGFPTSVIAHRVRVLGGTSHQFDGHLQPGQVISGNVSPKSQNGDYRWLNSTPINIEFFTSPTLQFTPDPYARAISWSPQTVAKQQNIASGKRSQLDVGPPQDWAVQEGQTIPFHFEFGVRGEYGAPRDFDGRVPQVYATWVNGLTPGRYYVRAWAEDHVQSAKDGSFQEYYFDVAPNETGADIPLRIELRKSGLQR